MSRRRCAKSLPPRAELVCEQPPLPAPRMQLGAAQRMGLLQRQQPLRRAPGGGSHVDGQGGLWRGSTFFAVGVGDPFAQGALGHAQLLGNGAHALVCALTHLDQGLALKLSGISIFCHGWRSFVGCPQFQGGATSSLTLGEPLPGRHIGHVRYPQLVDVGSHEFALYQIGGWSLAWMALGCHAPCTPTADPLQPVLAHEAGNAFAAGHHALIGQLCTDAGHAVGGIAGLVGGTDGLE